MFRISHFLRELQSPTPLTTRRQPPGPVVIWNLIRRCNLACMHCYTNSSDREFKGELSTQEVFNVMDDLHRFHVPVLILSGGEPLLRPDIFDIASRAKKMGFYVGLSTNGTFIDQTVVTRLKNLNLNYVGISLDGIGKTHDQFRKKEGAFEAALNGIRLCRDHGIKVGVRFTLTQDTFHDFPKILKFLDDEKIDKFYLSHLNYSGRGNTNRKTDAHFEMTRTAMQLLFDEAWRCLTNNIHREFVTGNNDADGVFLLHWIEKNFPEQSKHVRAKLAQFGGNSTGVNIANIDNLGNVHPDSFWWNYTLGNVRERPFSEIWTDTSDPLMAGLKKNPRTIHGRCSECSYFDVCNGNTRVRAYQTTKDFWAEDPGCYLTDSEIGLQSSSLFEGLQHVATGKSGSEPCSLELSQKILNDLEAGRVHPVSRAAFFTALFYKGWSESEEILKNALPPHASENPEKLISALASDIPENLFLTCVHLLRGNTLTRSQALEVGRFLFSSHPSDTTRAVISTLLRVRYTEPEEYVGLLHAIQETYQNDFLKKISITRPIVQFAEPFNGVNRSEMISPLLAQTAIDAGYHPVFLMGRSAGPKYGVNLLDLFQNIKNLPGLYIHQKELSPALDRWVEIRKLILRRPFLATLERLVNPLHADVLVVSAFHHGFQEKMVEIAEASGYPCIVVVFRGSEGSLGLSLARSAMVLISKKQSNGSYLRNTFKYTPADFQIETQPDPKETSLSTAVNAKKISTFMSAGCTDDTAFDTRVVYTRKVFERIFDDLK